MGSFSDLTLCRDKVVHNRWDRIMILLCRDNAKGRKKMLKWGERSGAAETKWKESRLARFEVSEFCLTPRWVHYLQWGTEIIRKIISKNLAFNNKNLKTRSLKIFFLSPLPYSHCHTCKLCFKYTTVNTGTDLLLLLREFLLPQLRRDRPSRFEQKIERGQAPER